MVTQLEEIRKQLQDDIEKVKKVMAEHPDDADRYLDDIDEYGIYQAVIYNDEVESFIEECIEEEIAKMKLFENARKQFNL